MKMVFMRCVIIGPKRDPEIAASTPVNISEKLGLWPFGWPITQDFNHLAVGQAERRNIDGVCRRMLATPVTKPLRPTDVSARERSKLTHLDNLRPEKTHSLWLDDMAHPKRKSGGHRTTDR